jgi:hypothetical protein
MRAFWKNAYPACCCCGAACSCCWVGLRAASRCTVAPATAPPGITFTASRPSIAAAAAPASACADAPTIAPATAASPASWRVIVRPSAPRARALLPVAGVGDDACGANQGLAGSYPLCCTAQAEHCASSCFCCSGDCIFVGWTSCCAAVGATRATVARQETKICNFQDMACSPSVTPQPLLGSLPIGNACAANAMAAVPRQRRKATKFHRVGLWEQPL